MIHSKKVVIFGAGIAGLTAAHEFSKRGYKVTIYEANSESGGFFRSARKEENKNSPSEYSWHGLGPFYHNVFSLFKEIPFDSKKNLYEAILSRPIDFGLASTKGTIRFDEPKSKPINVRKLFSFTIIDYFFWSWIMLKVWCSNRRSRLQYSRMNAKNTWMPFLSSKGIQNWSSCFGPWIGSDYFNVSVHQVGKFFLNQLITKEKYEHKSDEEGPSWTHTARSGWLLLNGPSNEVLFDKWVSHLKNQGVVFFWNQKLSELHYQNNLISQATLESSEVIEADIFVLAINPFSASQIIKKTPALLNDKQLRKFPKLIEDGPHTQVSFRLAFKEKINWNRNRCGLIIVDSAFNLTLFAQEQAWTKNINLGDEIKSLWTITACVSKTPGSVHGLPLEKCTKDQFIDEVIFQLNQCESLNELIKTSNNGKNFKEFEISHIEVWDEWIFDPKGIKAIQPKWVNSTNTQKHIPTQKTGIANLVLAGAHTQTSIDVWSIEAAVESGKRAVKIFENDVELKIQYEPGLLKIVRKFDDFLYFFKLPQIIDCSLILVILVLFYVVFSYIC